jgi:hypothetical protein
MQIKKFLFIIYFIYFSILLILPEGQYRDLYDTTNDFMIAVKDKNISKIQELIITKIDTINMTDENGNSSLLQAIIQDSDDIAILLIDNGADPKIVNNEYKSALDLAVSENKTELIKKIKSVLLDKLSNIKNISINSMCFIYDRYTLYLSDQSGDNYGFFDPDFENKTMIDYTSYPFNGLINKDILFDCYKHSGNLFFIDFSFGIGCLTGLIGTGISIPGIICNAISGYYYPDDFFYSNGNYLGVVGTVFLGISGFIILFAAANFIVSLALYINETYYNKKLQNELDRVLKKVKKDYGIKISFEIRVN